MTCGLQPAVDFHAYGNSTKAWHVLQCTACGSLIIVQSEYTANLGYVLNKTFPELKDVSAYLPEPERNYLEQAFKAVGEAADGTVMLATSAIDAMLKDKGYSSDH